MKHAQNRRCTSSICEQSLGKVLIKRNENFWSYRLHKFGTPKMLRTDGQMDREICLSLTLIKKEKKNETLLHKIRGAHLQCVNNHYAKFEYKGMNTVGVTDYIN